MKKAIMIGIFGMAIMSSCKYTQTPEGEYTGTFSCYMCPLPTQSASDAKLVITQEADEEYTMVLKYPGNPDITVSNIPLSRRSTLDGNVWEDEVYYSSNHDILLLIYEHDYLTNGWRVTADYESDTTDFDFEFYTNY